MPQAKGSKVTILVDKESVYKTNPASAQSWAVPFVSESVQGSRDMVESNSIRASRNATTPVLGNAQVAGDLNVELCPINIGRWLHYALGTVTSTGGGPYTHTFKVGDLPSFSLEKQFTDLTTPQYFKFMGCKINSMKMSLKPGAMVDTTFNIIGAVFSVSLSSSSSGTTNTTGFTPFSTFQANIRDGSPTPATISIVTECDFTVENNLDDTVFVLDNTSYRYSLPEGKVKVSGTIKTLFEDMTLYYKAINSTETSLQINLVRGTGVGSITNEKLTIDIPELIYQPQAPVVDGPGGVFVELPFTAYYDNHADASTIKMSLYNSINIVNT